MKVVYHTFDLEESGTRTWKKQMRNHVQARLITY
nr:MAG TPA: hypothetical protein [Caudoviricetes sp.]